MKIEIDFKEECKKLASEIAELERNAECCAKWVPGCFLSASGMKTDLPLIQLLFPRKESDLEAVEKFFEKHENEGKRKRALTKKLLQQLKISAPNDKSEMSADHRENENEDDDPELAAELAAEEAYQDDVMCACDLERIHSIDISDPDSFMRVAAYANRFKHEFNRLSSDESGLCVDCGKNRYAEYIKYQKPLRDKFFMLIGYWSAKYKDITAYHESRTSRSTDTKRRNKETAKRIVIDAYRKFSRNYADKSDLLLLSERKILLRMKTAVDPVLKAKGIYRNGISTNTLGQILREAKEKGKISSYPKHGI